MELGAFSVSLSVQDLGASRAFYEKLGLSAMGGDEESWLILQNGTTTIGLFHGMFEGNILTFNPGWSAAAEKLEDFADIRALKDQFLRVGLTPDSDTTAESDGGPASLTLTDPDGNAILFDQHV